MSAPVLEVSDLTVRYGGVEALHGVSLRVEAGQIITVIGPNGAGKTSLLNGIMGLLPFEGRIALNGSSRHLASVESRVEAGLGLVTETRDLFGSMTVEDNLVLGAFHRRRERGLDMRQEIGAVFALFPKLEERRMQLAQTLSGGERQMLALGRALMARPRLLMLDEPSLGLAPLVVREIFGMIERLREREVAILLVEQNSRAALKASDHAYVLENGGIALEGPAQDLIINPRVTESYLGMADTKSATGAEKAH